MSGICTVASYFLNSPSLKLVFFSRPHLDPLWGQRSGVNNGLTYILDPVTFSLSHWLKARQSLPLSEKRFQRALHFLTQYCLIFRLYHPFCLHPSERNFNLPIGLSLFSLFFFFSPNERVEFESYIGWLHSRFLDHSMSLWNHHCRALNVAKNHLDCQLCVYIIFQVVCEFGRTQGKKLIWETKNNQQKRIFQSCFPIGMVNAIQRVG